MRKGKAGVGGQGQRLEATRASGEAAANAKDQVLKSKGRCK